MKKITVIKISEDKFDLIEGKVQVSLECIGEGYNGDYNEKDPEDARLLRMDVSILRSVKNDYAEDGGGTWKSMLDSSYCTNLRADDKATAEKALRFIMSEVKDSCLSGRSIKRICERLSHLSASDFDKEGNCTLDSF